MLKKRIIPIVLIDGFSVLKTINFDRRRNLGSPVTVMRTYNTRNVDEMIILDIDASKQNRAIDKFLIKEITEDCFMPLTVGGGIKTLKDIEILLKSGADKISLNTSAIENINFVKEASENFGSQCIVASIDIKKTSNDYEVYNKKNGLLKLKLEEYIDKLQTEGAGEILINNVDKDGTLSGSEKNLSFLNNCSIPVIYAGGINSPEDATNTFLETNVDAVGISSLFHFTDHTPADCRRDLINNGIPSRL